jgi:hypothetical protein
LLKHPGPTSCAAHGAVHRGHDVSYKSSSALLRWSCLRNARPKRNPPSDQLARAHTHRSARLLRDQSKPYSCQAGIHHPMVCMQRTLSPPPEQLRQALIEIIRSPIRTLVPPWSWKAAVFTAVMRGAAFFVSNLRSGNREATKALLVEALFAVFAGGLIGAVSQRLRRARPLWATALLVCAGLPAAMLIAQLGLHRLAGTPHQSAGVIASFCLSAGAAAYTWYAMRHGAMLGGIDETTVGHDLRSMPGISLNFLLLIPRALAARAGAASKRS